MAVVWDTRRFGPYEDARFTLRRVVDFALYGNEYTVPALASVGPVCRWGRPERMNASPRPIPFEELGIDDEVDVDRSEWTTTVRRWFDVRLIPVLEAPNRADCLLGITLVDAVDKYVAEDLLVERERADNGGSFRPLDPICEARLFPIGHHEIDTGRQMMEAATASRRGKGQPPRTFGRYYVRLAQRLNLLVETIRSGTVATTGLLPTTRARVTIDPAWWSRPGITLDLQTGDLLSSSGEIDWLAVGLTKPAATLETPTWDLREANGNVPPLRSHGVEEPTATGARMQRRGSTRGSLPDSVKSAFLELWPNDTPAGIGRKQIDPAIREHLGFPRDGESPSQRTITEGIIAARREIQSRLPKKE